jgi:hypothetical protein
MKNICLIGGVIIIPSMLGGLAPAMAAPPEIVSPRQASQVVAVTEVKTRGSSVSGLLVNKSPEVVRDPQLLIRQSWLWNKEFHPGDDSPGRAEFYTVNAEIPPHGQTSFSYDTAPLPRRTDGHFKTTVQVTGFTEVGTDTTSARIGANTLGR